MSNNRTEIFNFKDEEGFRNFVLLTDKNPELADCFSDEEEDIDISSKRWLKIMNKIIGKSFRKIRLGKSKANPELETFFMKKENLMESLSKAESRDDFHAQEDIKSSLNEVIEQIASLCCEKNKKITEEYLKSQSDAIEGFSQPNTWKLKKKLAPKNTIDPPAAKQDKFGNLVTDKEGLEALYLDTYIQRLKPNKIADGLEELKSLKEYL